jgi:cell division protease FtsH
MNEPQNFPKNNQPRKPGKRNPVVINIIILLTVTVLVWFLFSFGTGTLLSPKKPDEFSSLISEIKRGAVKKITVSEDKTRFSVDVFKNLEVKSGEGATEVKTFKNISTDRTSALQNISDSLTEEEKKNFKLGTGSGEIEYKEEEKSAFAALIESPLFGLLLQVAIIVAIGMFLLRRLGDVNSKSISFGNSRAKSYDDLPLNKRVTFEDVAGNEEAKLELSEVVDFLKRPQEYEKMGAKIPRGVLLVGGPGNGKTLLARAVAGEAKVPFLFVSGSEFVEMFVGVGAGRVRDLFKQAKKQAPCIIFIDEIDAVGRKRGSGFGNGNDEREQTLNQILVEMDGFEISESVIVLAATNRADVLDKALLRPGRFDRQVTVTAPDSKERKMILELHAKNKKMAKDADFGIIARRTGGFSGADLMNVLNESAILAVRNSRKSVTNDDMREAIEKVSMGPALKSKVITEEQRKLTAYHEAAHAVVASVIPEADKVQKITIIPRGRAGGYTFTDRGETDPMTIKHSKFMAEISVLYAGYIVEKAYFGETSTGPSNDLERATDIAKRMVTKYGMSNLGPIDFTETRYTPDGMEYEESQLFSDEAKKEVDKEIKAILNKAYVVAEKILKEYKKMLDEIAKTLLEKEVLEFEEYEGIVKKYIKA